MPTRDPTNTGKLRKAFRAAVQKRVTTVRSALKVALLDQDLLGLSASVTPINRPGFVAGMTDAQRLTMFSDWFSGLLYNGLVGRGASWAQDFIKQAYDQGLDTATKELKIPMFLIKGKASSTLMQLAQHELEGIADATVQQGTRLIADQLLARTRSIIAFRALSTKVNEIALKRSELLANSLTVRAFNDAKLDVYKEAHISKVGIDPETRVTRAHVHDAPSSTPSGSTIARITRRERQVSRLNMVEVLTAGDDLVCDECDGIAADGPYEIDTARGLIPAHPNCRCAFVPYADRRFAPASRGEDA